MDQESSVDDAGEACEHGRAHWSVTVERRGERLVTIESACLAGKPDLTEEDLETIREAGRNLLAFAGLPAAERAPFIDLEPPAPVIVRELTPSEQRQALEAAFARQIDNLDPTCEHGRALDVHCCGCRRSGFFPPGDCTC